ncbi:hypothetical protein SKAU_G00373750 [Synaphobranchus kaupii]|uniref:Uncharacterized protein n=1 Tax=Synaphobranchus kaupii TaxID=118154 RepID=A0A9Q1EGL0_SYNKA|nr:hypothetical protein SKAU_G00373750 [Synaphobranchus kaupii]
MVGRKRAKLGRSPGLEVRTQLARRKTRREWSAGRSVVAIAGAYKWTEGFPLRKAPGGLQGDRSVDEMAAPWQLCAVVV